ncbi:MAG: FAD:protein FMN transferase [Tannerellaceae bacterium]|nr:FAD:protein FMN transferase [Tannerellaceae bacterium]
MTGIYKQLTDRQSMYYTWFSAMHTRVDIVLCNRSEEECKGIGTVIYNAIRQLEQAGNYFNPSGELALLNNQLPGTPLVVSELLFSAIWESLDYGKLTAGCFDVTIESDSHTPETAKAVCMDIEHSAISFDKPGIRINLSGFLKGYALENIRTILERFHIKDALINMGNSSVLALGNHPCAEGWKIGIDLNGQTNREVTLFNECLTTSGNESTGRKHIRSPYTGKYVEGVRGVSVVTRRATEGEALSTALFVASPQQRESILKNFSAIVYDI